MPLRPSPGTDQSGVAGSRRNASRGAIRSAPRVTIRFPTDGVVMERRVLLAIFLSFLVLYLYQALVVKPVPKPVGANETQSASRQAPVPPPTVPGPTSPAVAGGPKGPGHEPSAAGAVSTVKKASTSLVGDSSEHDIRVETNDVIAVFTNHGGRLKSWRLKHYRDLQGQPQEIIENTPGQPLPFTLRTTNAGVNDTINDALYAVKAAPASDTSGESAPVDLRFEYRDNSGLHVLKQFHLEPASYILAVQAEVTDGAMTLTPAVEWGPAVGDVAETTRYSQKAEGLLLPNDKVQRLSPKDIAKQPTYEGDFRYAGVDDNYFMTVALAPGPVKVTFQPVSIPAANPKESARDLVSYSVEPGQADVSLRYFVGPKDFDVLGGINSDLTKAINFGIFQPIVVSLLRSLKWVNGFVGNYGWSIVILTVIINLVLFPLQHKSIVSMRRMQEIQPQMKAIQDRYAKYKTTDPEKQKMNQELMALYKEKGVNPASGCVPMLLTIPVLYAMWAMLSTAIELRGAPFVGWIHDLTAHDPYYVIPVLMGATQVWMMKMTPTVGADPAQQRMQMVMPVVMTAMFLWLPAGALIYYVVSNLWRIGQQYVTNAIIGPPNVRTVRPPAERRLKRKDG
jgi:YidC/Oxa1 family membrane protein insertase